jgi:hypothetical protein
LAGHDADGLAVRVFEDQAALRTLQHVRRVVAGGVAICAVAVEVERVIIAGVGAEVLAKLVECWRAEDIHVGGQVAGADEFYERQWSGSARRAQTAARPPAGC